jgi:hypothetical protein
MQVVAGMGGLAWHENIERNLRMTHGKVRVRGKGEKRPLAADLERAGLVVTWSSCAAVQALLDGIRVLCAPECCATYADHRGTWAAVLADNQWTLDEIRHGAAWREFTGDVNV